MHLPALGNEEPAAAPRDASRTLPAHSMSVCLLSRMTSEVIPSKSISVPIADIHGELIHIGAGRFSEFTGNPQEMMSFVNRVADAIWNESEHRKVLESFGVGRDRVTGLYIHAFTEAVESHLTVPSVTVLLQIYGSPFGLSRLLKTIADYLERAGEAKRQASGNAITAASIRFFYLTVAKETGPLSAGS